RRYTKREGRLMVMTLQSTTGQIDCIIFDRELDEVIATLGGREPAVGDILCVSGAVQVKAGFKPKSEDEGTGDDADAVTEYVREITVDEVTVVDLDELGVSDTDDTVPTCDMSPITSFFAGEDPTQPGDGPDDEGDDPDDSEPDETPDTEGETDADESDGGGDSADDSAASEPGVTEAVPTTSTQKRRTPPTGVCDLNWTRVPLSYLPEGIVTIFQIGGHTMEAHFRDGIPVSEIDEKHAKAHQQVRLAYVRDRDSRVPWTKVLIGDEVSHVCIVDDDGTVLGIDGEPMSKPLGDGEEFGISGLFELPGSDNDRHYQPLVGPEAKCMDMDGRHG